MRCSGWTKVNIVRCRSTSPRMRAVYVATAQRSSVFQQPASIPDVHYVYVPRDQIMPPEERVFAGIALSGRIAVWTHLEIEGTAKALGLVLVDFDERNEVVGIRVDGYGFDRKQ
jgi:hypothetical protein